MSRKAVIFGVTGQDGSYLAEHLLALGYDVTGVSRRTSSPSDWRIAHLYGRGLRVVPGDITDAGSVFRVLTLHDPDEVYNLAAQSHVKVSFDEPSHTTDVVYKGCLNILEWLRAWHESSAAVRVGPRFYQASSSEMFGPAASRRYKGDYDVVREDYRTAAEAAAYPYSCGDIYPLFQDEATPFLPCSPYAIAKLAAHLAVKMYREAYGVWACSGILYNHESERRGEEFVTRKITRYVAKLARARADGVGIEPLALGNLHARRDWGAADDYVQAMWLMLQQGGPDDYVIATGETHTVAEFLALAMAAIGVEDVDAHCRIDAQLFRPCEVPYLLGDAGKARKGLGWEPKTSFAGLVSRMVYADLERLHGKDFALSALCSVRAKGGRP